LAPGLGQVSCGLLHMQHFSSFSGALPVTCNRTCTETGDACTMSCHIPTFSSTVASGAGKGGTFGFWNQFGLQKYIFPSSAHLTAERRSSGSRLSRVALTGAYILQFSALSHLTSSPIHLIYLPFAVHPFNPHSLYQQTYVYKPLLLLSSLFQSQLHCINRNEDPLMLDDHNPRRGGRGGIRLRNPMCRVCVLLW